MCMNNLDSHEKELSYSILDSSDTEEITKIGKALSSKHRINILKLLSKRPMNLLEISEILKMPVSSVSFNIDVLAESKLIIIEYKPATKGHMKLCSINMSAAHIFLEKSEEEIDDNIVVEMPVGCYTSAQFSEGSLVGNKGFIYREKDCPEHVFTPKRINGQLFSFKDGYVEYDFPNLIKKSLNPHKLSFSMEICSEAPFYRNDWPSDITVWINDVEIGTYTSPGDFGGKRGVLTPLFWKTNSTQYGILKTFSIDSKGCYIDNTLVSSAKKYDDLNIKNCKSIKLRIGFKPNAVHIGGINIFGKQFGNYAQDIVLTISKDGYYDL